MWYQKDMTLSCDGNRENLLICYANMMKWKHKYLDHKKKLLKDISPFKKSSSSNMCNLTIYDSTSLKKYFVMLKIFWTENINDIDTELIDLWFGN